MTAPTPQHPGQPEGLVAILTAARDAHAAVLRDGTVVGCTEAERRFSAGEIEDRANEAMFAELTSLTREHIKQCLALAAQQGA